MFSSSSLFHAFASSHQSVAFFGVGIGVGVGTTATDSSNFWHRIAVQLKRNDEQQIGEQNVKFETFRSDSNTMDFDKRKDKEHDRIDVRPMDNKVDKRKFFLIDISNKSISVWVRRKDFLLETMVRHRFVKSSNSMDHHRVFCSLWVHRWNLIEPSEMKLWKKKKDSIDSNQQWMCYYLFVLKSLWTKEEGRKKSSVRDVWKLSKP